MLVVYRKSSNKESHKFLQMGIVPMHGQDFIHSDLSKSKSVSCMEYFLQE